MLLIGLVLALSLTLEPLAAEAQQTGKVPSIGWLSAASPAASAAPRHPAIEGFLQGLRELGYIEGRTIVIEYRFAEGKFDRLPGLADDLVRLKVAVIVTAGGPASLSAAMRATSSIPIVMAAASGDPVRAGIVKSLARPGGNVTGIAATADAGIVGKRLELLKEVVPGLVRVAVLWDVNDGPYVGSVASKEADTAARALGLHLLPLEVRTLEDIDGAVGAAVKERVGALYIRPTPLFSGSHRAPLIKLAMRHQLPTISGWRNFAEAGGLMSYGAISHYEQFRRAAAYVDRVLKGAKPADLPIEQPTKFELVVNLKTAKALGLTIPQSILVRAEIIQ